MEQKDNDKLSNDGLNSFQTNEASIQNQEEKDLIFNNSKNISPGIKIQQKFLEKGKEISPTIFDEKIKKQASNEIPKIIPSENELKKISKNDFLKVRKIKKIEKNEFEIIKNEIIGRENLNYLYEDIMNCKYLPLNEIDFGANIGCMLPFASLVESLFNNNAITIEEMTYRYELFKEYVFNYRPIKGDGNCFYRAVIFRYFEIVILNKKIELLRNIISEMYESFSSNEINSRLRIKYNFILNHRLVLLILIIILELLEEGKIAEAHYFYVKSINIEDSFDYGLILYFRYIFYLYIKQNENKYYLENFAIKIGNLLPSNYETEKGMFLFNKFYYLYLLSMFTDAEKIIIHLTPFVLGINLDVIIFNDDEDKTIKNMIYSGDNEYTFKEDKLFVLNIIGHYELLYNEEDNNKNKDIFQKYINTYYFNMNNNKIELNEPDKKEKNEEKEEKEEKKDNFDNNALYESSSVPFVEKSNNEKNDECVSSNENEEKKETSDIKETKNKYKVQIKILNQTTKKPKKSFSLDDEISENNNDISNKIKYSEKKDINYTNLIMNNQRGQNNNNEIKDDEKIENSEKNGIDKQINIEKQNLIEKINNLIDDEEGKYKEEINKEASLMDSKVNNENQISNINMNSENKKIINEYSQVQEIKCIICSKNYIKKNSNSMYNEICQDCLKENIIKKTSQMFFSYMEDSISNKNHQLAYKTYFNEFIENKIDILNEKISIKNALLILDNKYKTNIEMHPIFQEMKKNFCIFCLEDLDKTKFEIPCKCNFCSIDHIKKYFHMKNNIKNKSNYVCICSHEYTNEDIYNIGIFFLFNRLFSLKEDTIDYLNYNFLDKKCCFCSESINIKNRKRIKIKDFEDEIILGDTNKLRHHICTNCCYQYRNNVETFSCFICNKNHIVVNNLFI